MTSASAESGVTASLIALIILMRHRLVLPAVRWCLIHIVMMSCYYADDAMYMSMMTPYAQLCNRYKMATTLRSSSFADTIDLRGLCMFLKSSDSASYKLTAPSPSNPLPLQSPPYPRQSFWIGAVAIFYKIIFCLSIVSLCWIYLVCFDSCPSTL